MVIFIATQAETDVAIHVPTSMKGNNSFITNLKFNGENLCGRKLFGGLQDLHLLVIIPCVFFPCCVCAGPVTCF